MTTTATPYDDLQAALEFGLADRLAKSLQVSGITTAEIAEAVDCSLRTIGNYTSGRTRPGKLVMREWAARTGVPLQWLETGIFPANRPLSD